MHTWIPIRLVHHWAWRGQLSKSSKWGPCIPFSFTLGFLVSRRGRQPLGVVGDSSTVLGGLASPKRAPIQRQSGTDWSVSVGLMPVSVVVAACFLTLLISPCIRHSQPPSAHLATQRHASGCCIISLLLPYWHSHFSNLTSYSPLLLRRLLCAFFLTTRRDSSFLFFLSARLGFPTTTASPLPPSLLAFSPTSRSRRDLLPACCARLLPSPGGLRKRNATTTPRLFSSAANFSSKGYRYFFFTSFYFSNPHSYHLRKWPAAMNG